MKKIIIFFVVLISRTFLFSEVTAEFPFIINDMNQMLLYAEINNDKGWYFFDTGSPKIFVFSDFDNLPIIQKNGSFIIFNNEYKSDICLLNQINISDIEIQGKFEILKLPISIKDYFQNIKGVLGLSIFENKILEISFTDNMIRIHDEIPISSQYDKNTTMYFKDNNPFININFDDKEIPFLIDTGWPGYLLFPEYIRKSLNKKDFCSMKILNKHISEPFNDFYLMKIKKFNLFDIEFCDKIIPTSTYVTKNENGIIGYSFLKNFNLLFDTKNNRLFVKSNISEETLNLFLSKDVYGNGMFNYDFVEQGLQVTEIIVNSPAWNNGIRVGTIITEIDNINVYKYSVARIERILGGKEEITITFISGKSEKKVVCKSTNILGF